MKVLVELFQKLIESRGEAFCRTPQSAKSPCSKERRRGEKHPGGMFFAWEPPGARVPRCEAQTAIYFVILQLIP